jgi:hypothetical protein
VKRIALALCVSISSSLTLAQSEFAVNGADTDMKVVLPDTKARQQFKLLSKEVLSELAQEDKKRSRVGFVREEQHYSAEKNTNVGNVQRLEEIRIYGILDPEDYIAPKPPPMLAFRATLDKQRPKTPQEITQGLLCTIGLCIIDVSKEPNPADRNEARAKAPPSFATQR